MERNRAWRRKQDYAKALRKKNIVKAVCIDGTWYEHYGQYIKEKIHCSCPLCSCKTNNRGRYGAAMNYSLSDHRNLDAMNYQLREYISA